VSIIFLATSPLHVIISTLIASSLNKEKCNLVLCGKEKQRIKQFHALISDWPESPFAKVFALDKAKRPKDFINVITEVKPTEVITGNDLVPEFFAIAHLANNYTFNLSYMDDGLHSYIEYKKELPSKFNHSLKNLVRKISKGYKKPFPHTLGSSPLTKKAYLFFPNLAKDNILNKECSSIGINKNSRNLLSSFGRHCLKNLHIDFPRAEETLALFVLPHFSRMNNSIKNEFIRAIKQAVVSGMTPMIKNHPSNNDDLISGYKSLYSKVYIIPKSLPVELIICHHPPQFIMGGLSSIFLSTKALTNEVRFNLINDDYSSIPEQLSNFLIQPT